MGKKFKVRQSDWTQDFRYINYQDASELGVCYEESKRVWITLHRHESEENIIDTIIHESIHQAIRSETVAPNEMGEMALEQEHEMMKRMIWAIHDWVL